MFKAKELKVSDHLKQNFNIILILYYLIIFNDSICHIRSLRH